MPRESETPALERLPFELREYISRFLDKPTAISLARVSVEWREVAEPVIWREISVIDRRSSIDPSTLDHDAAGVQITRILDALQARPKRLAFVRGLFVNSAYESLDSVKQLVKVTSPTLERLRLVGKEDDWDEFGLQTWTMDLVCAALPIYTPAQRLRRILVSTGMDFVDTVKECLRIAPNLEEIGIMNDGSWELRSISAWPSATALRTIRIGSLNQGMLETLAHMLKHVSPNITFIDIGEWELYDNASLSETLKIILRHKGLKAFKTDNVVGGRWSLSALLSGVHDPFPDLEALYLPRHDETWKNTPHNLHDVLWNAPICLPRLRYVFLRDMADLVGNIHHSITVSRETGALPTWIPIFESCPELRRTIFLSGGSFSETIQAAPDSDPRHVAVSYLDYFRATRGSVALRHIALRVEKGLYEHNFAVRMANGDCPDYIAYDRDCGEPWELEQVTEHLVLLDDRIVPDTVWKNMYDASHVASSVQGIGNPHMELSEAAWRHAEV